MNIVSHLRVSKHGLWWVGELKGVGCRGLLSLIWKQKMGFSQN
uniref:Uncharacterized protein n=1 Tax=Rhizophora mucronata TaxID=61149 RepID=A0A2P2QH82_RHIMU